jgi:hypothetical protein
LVELRSRGTPGYQYVYREAAGVYWSNDLGGFVSRDRGTWSCADWVEHIISVCQSIGIDLELSEKTVWVNVADADKATLLERRGIGGDT